jgi:Transglycosylase SLT domain
MRPILALVALLLGLSSAAPEPEYSSLYADYLQTADGNTVRSLVEIESSIGRADRLPLFVPPQTQPTAELRGAEPAEPPAVMASSSSDDGGLHHASAPPVVLASADPGDGGLHHAPTSPVVLASADPNDGGLHHAPASADVADDIEDDEPLDVSLDDLCYALLNSAQDNALPVPFFANLLWQESRLQNDTVSRAGALGIAQFMPETAAESGLEDPFDPLQAIPASARLIRELRQQFGNLGLAAAAYNAGARRVAEWLKRRRRLPRETRDYVVHVTGRSAEQWRKTPPDDRALTFVRRLPCRSLPAFADLEQQQVEKLKPEQDAKLEQAQDAQADEEPAKSKQAESEPADTPKPTPEPARVVHHLAFGHRHPHSHVRAQAVHSAAHNRSGKHQANRTPHLARDKHKSA